MRNSSAANSAASSPPVPARTSRIALRSSSASLGNNASLTRHLQVGSRSRQDLQLLLGQSLQFRIVGRLRHLAERNDLALRLAQRVDARRRSATARCIPLTNFLNRGAPEPAAAERSTQFSMAPAQLLETRFERSFHAPRLSCRVPGVAAAARRAEQFPARGYRDRSSDTELIFISSSPISTAARAFIRLARRNRRCRLPE